MMRLHELVNLAKQKNNVPVLQFVQDCLRQQVPLIVYQDEQDHYHPAAILKSSFGCMIETAVPVECSYIGPNIVVFAQEKLAGK